MNASERDGALDWSEASVLVTGGTGSFGNKFVEIMLSRYRPRRLVVFSRDELKQSEMIARFNDPALRFFVGDVRDQARLERAMHGVDVVFHAAALKQIPSCEYNPFEAIQTNVIGAENVISAAIDARVKRVVMISTDKAVNPINLYGATKLCAEKLFIQGNAYGYPRGTVFSVVRYGNVIGSRGSVQRRVHRHATRREAPRGADRRGGEPAGPRVRGHVPARADLPVVGLQGSGGWQAAGRRLPLLERHERVVAVAAGDERARA